jgi:8-oxo-dGTP pyrophosphatase MutT (NUDIX family)
MMEAGRLIALLAHHRAADPGEEASLLKILKFLSLSPGPFDRANPEGHITGSAVVARPDGKAFLLVHHRRLDRWLQPGGHTDPEDTDVLATALREVREETGVLARPVEAGGRPFDVDVHPIPARKGEPEHLHFDLRFLATASDTDLTPHPEETREVRWCTLEEARAIGADPSVLRALEKASGLLSAGATEGT